MPVDKTVYVDDLQGAVSKNPHAKRVGSRHNHQWCHMWCEDLDTLHEMARRIGLKREWFQDHRLIPHYDLVPTKRCEALRLGAKYKSARDAMMELRKKRGLDVLPNNIHNAGPPGGEREAAPGGG